MDKLIFSQDVTMAKSDAASGQDITLRNLRRTCCASCLLLSREGVFSSHSVEAMPQKAPHLL